MHALGETRLQCATNVLLVERFGAIWASRGSLESVFGPVPGGFWEPLWAVVEASWGVWGASWGYWTIWAASRAVWNPFGAVLGRS